MRYIKQTDRVFTKEHRENLSKARKGCIPWNVGKKWSEEVKQKIRDSKKGENPKPWLGKKRPDISLLMSKIHKGKIPWNKGIKGLQKNPFKGKKRPELSGSGNANWKGGKSFEPYSLSWTNTLKQSIRERDNFACQICSEKQEERKLDVHHIDYDKENCNPTNLISLCIPCHRKTNGKRKFWIEFFKNKIVI